MAFSFEEDNSEGLDDLRKKVIKGAYQEFPNEKGLREREMSDAEKNYLSILRDYEEFN